jgi:hypothetical protein
MTPFDWDKAMAPNVPWQEAYATVERMARAHLEHNPMLDGDLSTADLVDALYPEEWARGEGVTARKRIFKSLAALATRGLAAYCHRGPERKLAHSAKMVRPWLWHAPREANVEAQAAGFKPITCPHCGGRFNAERST